jgi:hypothetical protein
MSARKVRRNVAGAARELRADDEGGAGSSTVGGESRRVLGRPARRAWWGLWPVAVVAVCGLGVLTAPAAQADPDPTFLASLPLLTDCADIPVEIPVDYNAGLAVLEPCVYVLQQSLQAVGYAVPTDGFYKKETYAAVWSFQAAHWGDGLNPTGEADAATNAVLDRVANSNAAFNSAANGAEPDGRPSMPPGYLPTIPHISVDAYDLEEEQMHVEVEEPEVMADPMDGEALP